jgi:2-polyprenyl-3-methyl-5-hydroxy-6-metoxy-1,4-benzoquinol methylase
MSAVPEFKCPLEGCAVTEIHHHAVEELAASRLSAPTSEQTKYERMWQHAQYRQVAPGESAASHFLSVARPRHDGRVIDFGCGTGRGALMIALVGGLHVDMVDFAMNCLDKDIQDMLSTQAHALKFWQADLAKALPPDLVAEFGFCTDVMEHIPEAEVDAALRNILQHAQHVYFQISTTDDACGALIGEKLHLSVHDGAWWLKKFQELECQVHYFQEVPGNVIVYVSAWQTGQHLVDIGELNVEEREIRAHVKENTAGGWKQVSPHEPNGLEVLLLGGGPSLEREYETIKFLRERGAKLVTMNGAYQWALSKGLKVSAQIVVDARPHNARFTKPVQEDTLYLIGSQVHPLTLEGLPKERTWLWHTTAEIIKDELDVAYGEGKWFGIVGGCTVLLRAIPLLRMLGYSQFHLFGCDSCLSEEGAHHAYAQPENDNQLVMPVIVGGRRFDCNPWQVAQATEFIELIKVMGDLFECEVHGGGLLAWILEHGCALEIEREKQEQPTRAA